MKNLKKWITIALVILNISVLAVFFYYNRNRTYTDNDISRIFELKIDSIRNEILKREQIVDSLNTVVIKNDLIINDLTSYINALKNERIIIIKEYENKNEELKKRSNDSIVMFVRQQLLLWTER